MGNDEGNVEGAGGVPPSGGPEDSRDVSLENRGGGMGVVIGGGGIGGGRSMSYGGIHLEEEVYHCGLYWEPPNL